MKSTQEVQEGRKGFRKDGGEQRKCRGSVKYVERKVGRRKGGGDVKIMN